MKKVISMLLVLLIICASLVFSSITTEAASSNDWQWPTNTTKVSANWPQYSDGRPHTGVDFGASLNSPVYSTCDGEVVSVQSLTYSYGKHIKIRATVNGNTVYMRYCHLNDFCVSVGDKVVAGQQIGVSGSTGKSTGPHLHYEVRGASDNTDINPWNYLPGTSNTFETWEEKPVDLGTDFYATISNTAFGGYLSKVDGTDTLYLQDKNGYSKQLWYFERQEDNAYYISSRTDGTLFEISGGDHENRTQVCAHTDNKGAYYQQWYFYEAEGGYRIKSKHYTSEGWYLDRSVNTEAEGQRVQIYEKGTDEDQTWTVDKNAKLWCEELPLLNLGESFSARIRNIDLNVLVTNFKGNAVVGRHFDSKIARQIWNFTRNADRSYTIKSCLNDNCLEVHNFDDFDGGNIAVIPENGSDAQKWFLYQNGDGSISLRPKCSADRVIDVTDGDPTDGNNVQLWSYYNNDNQKFAIEKCGEVMNCGDDFAASIEHNGYWKPLFQNDDGNVELTTSGREKMSGILWRFVRDKDNGWYTIMSYKNGKYLTVTNNSSAAGANVGCEEYNNSDGQHWYILKGTDENGEYRYLKAACSSNNLDLENNSIYDGTNIRMTPISGSGAQKYWIYVIKGDTSYSITADKTELTTGEDTTISINDTTFVISYKLHIIQPDGQEVVVDNGCDYQYQFKPDQVGEYVIYAEVESPVSTSKGSATDRSVTIKVSEKASVLLGDADGNGEVAVTDATWIQRKLAELNTVETFSEAAADVDGNGDVSVIDATWIQRKLANLKVPYKIGEAI